MWIACLTLCSPCEFCARMAQESMTSEQQPNATLFTMSTENANDILCRSHWDTLSDPQWRSINVR